MFISLGNVVLFNVYLFYVFIYKNIQCSIIAFQQNECDEKYRYNRP